MNYLRKELYNLLKSDEAIFDFIQDFSLDGLWYWDLENPEEEWMNAKFWTTLGYDPAEMPHKAAAWQNIIFSEDLKAAIENLQKHLADPTFLYNQELRYRHKDGSTVWIGCRAFAIRDKNGKPIRVLGAHINLTELKRKEQLLTETNRAARVGAWELDLVKNTIYWSEVTKEIHEVSADYIPDLEKGINFYKEGESRAMITECVEKAISEGIPYDVELQIVTAKNKTIWIRAIGQPEFYEGACRRIYGVFQDIEKWKVAEKKLTESEEQFRQTFEHAVIGMALVNKKGVWTRVNDSFCELVGYSRVELLELGFQDLSHPDDLDDSIKELQELSRGERKVYLKEKRYIHKNGQDIWLVIGVSRVTNAEGKTLHYVAQYSDITERKLAEQKLRQSEKEIQQTFDNAVIGMALVDKTGKWIRVNDSLCQLLGYTRAALLTMTFADVSHPDYLKETYNHLEKLVVGEVEVFHREECFIHKSGQEVYAMVGVSKITNENGELIHYVAQYADITERKLAAEKIQKYAILETKTKEMEQFSYIVSHDLREPLATMKGYLNLLLEEFSEEMPEDAQAILQFSVDGANRMDDLIHGLLNYSRLSQVKELVRLDCKEIITTVLADLSATITKNKATFEIDDLPTLLGYPVEIKQLFQNLISNSIKFRKEIIPPIIQISSEKVKYGWAFKVKDNGIGIHESERERVFQIFQRLNKDYEGTGIGLANCKKIVELHNGEIWITSKLGEGSTFNFTILTAE